MIHKLLTAMIESFPDRKYVEHALKVLGYARAIGGGEGLAPDDLRVLEAAGVLHDIGIPQAIQLHGSGAGPYQEKEGANIAPDMLRDAGYGEADVDRATWLVAHHHSAQYIQQDRLLLFLMEADALVNLSEGKASADSIERTRSELFRSASGLRLLDALFGRDA